MMLEDDNLACVQKPWLGILSIGSPIFGAIAFFVIIQFFPGDPAGFGNGLLAIAVFFAMCFFGCIFSIDSFLRREPSPWLRRLGFLINLIPAIMAASHVV